MDDVGDPRVKRRVEGATGSVPVRYIAMPASGQGTAGASRNAGARASTAPLLAFLDDDDMWAPRFLERMIAELDESGSDLVVSWGRLDRDGQVISGILKMPSQIDPRTQRATNPGITGSNFVIRRSVFDALGGFDSDLPVFNDLDFFVRLIDAGYTYSVLQVDLVTQFSHAGEQLSTRSKRRANGIRRYVTKHRSTLNLRERRRLLREICVASRYPGRSPLLRAAFFCVTWLSAEPGDVVAALRRRVRAEPRAYR